MFFFSLFFISLVLPVLSYWHFFISFASICLPYFLPPSLFTLLYLQFYHICFDFSLSVSPSLPISSFFLYLQFYHICFEPFTVYFSLHLYSFLFSTFDFITFASIRLSYFSTSIFLPFSFLTILSLLLRFVYRISLFLSPRISYSLFFYHICFNFF